MTGYLVRVREYGSPARTIRTCRHELDAVQVAGRLVDVHDRDGVRRYDVIDIVHRRKIIRAWEQGTPIGPPRGAA